MNKIKFEEKSKKNIIPKKYKKERHTEKEKNLFQKTVNKFLKKNLFSTHYNPYFFLKHYYQIHSIHTFQMIHYQFQKL